MNSKSQNRVLVDQARELTDSLAKLARAAGIHLIFATQKVTKETIDTKIQENIGGRMCFRMNTLQGSLTVLGNKLANELTEQPGRAIWANGHAFTEVQAPIVTESDVIEELETISEEYKSGHKVLRQTMIASTGGSDQARSEVESYEVD